MNKKELQNYLIFWVAGKPSGAEAMLAELRMKMKPASNRLVTI